MSTQTEKEIVSAVLCHNGRYTLREEFLTKLMKDGTRMEDVSPVAGAILMDYATRGTVSITLDKKRSEYVFAIYDHILGEIGNPIAAAFLARSVAEELKPFTVDSADLALERICSDPISAYHGMIEHLD